MAFTREDIRESIERAGDEHWDALVRHHTEVYPESNPTPGDVCRSEAARLNDLVSAAGHPPAADTPPAALIPYPNDSSAVSHCCLERSSRAAGTRPRPA